MSDEDRAELIVEHSALVSKYIDYLVNDRVKDSEINPLRELMEQLNRKSELINSLSWYKRRASFMKDLGAVG